MDAVIKNLPINSATKGVSVLDIPSKDFIKKLAEVFKEKSIIKLPAYTSLVKCSHSNELSPLNANWFYVKAAAIARKIFLSKSKTMGIGSLKVLLGKKHRRGAQPNCTSKASGKIIRDIVGQLKKIGYAENYASTEGVTLGLLLTKSGRSALDKVAASISKN